MFEPGRTAERLSRQRHQLIADKTLEAYLSRIGYRGPTGPPTEDVLRAVHRAHATAIPYENLDVYRQVPVDQDIDRIFDKIVVNGRGGWCYEMNGLLGWALQQLGFSVRRLVGGVMRAIRGDQAFGNHLVLLVQLDQPWIADVGLGDGLLEAAPLNEGPFTQGHRQFRFEQLEPELWRFHNRGGGMPPSSDVRTTPVDEAVLAATCETLQTDPESTFRQNLVCQRVTDDGGHMVLGRVAVDMRSGAKRILEKPDFAPTLTTVLGRSVEHDEQLWQMVCARHAQLFGDQSAEEITFGAPPVAGD